MTVTDPISDLLTRMRNAMMARHKYMEIRWSKIKEGIVEILKEEGFVEDFFVKGQGAEVRMRVQLKYARDRKPVIQGLERVSRPGRRRYVEADKIRPVQGGMGICILTTSKGLMTGLKARRSKSGGEILCNVW